MHSWFPWKSSVPYALVLLAVSAGVNVLQAQKIKSMRDSGKPPSSIDRVAAPVAGFSMAGLPLELAPRGDVPTVLYYFSPTCSWCDRNWDNIGALVAAANGRYRVVAVSTTRGLREYADTRGLNLDVIEGISENTRQAFGFTSTPHTLVVSTEGVITHEWRGAFTPRIERQIEQLFGIELPGIRSAPAETPSK